MKQARISPVPHRKTAEPPMEEQVLVEDSDDTMLSDIDELLDEIDAVLENQSVLIGFRQRSGQ